MSHFDHKRLFLPGPVEVREEILRAQTTWMIGHRSAEFAELFARLQSKLRRAFFTESRVYIGGIIRQRLLGSRLPQRHPRRPESPAPDRRRLQRALGGD